ncbi:hypothetical protein BDV95DRAFT_603756 [Massariosphaeria phaeospora]|uniref:Uncharacterized protein n=1 Tax=Massariosphaeria phaeospora TaxID=100035 RepID=A0A7C8MGS1_9PLEO|nr:hypothetical protein BDV95DRAFT_603756 [Massariosphaeria phaeospora]
MACQVKLDEDVHATEQPETRLDKISKRNSIGSPLLRLPGEIRNRIWELATGGEGIEIWEDGQDYENGPKKCRVRRVRQQYRQSGYAVFRLSEICRQIQQETTVMPYALNTFTFSVLNFLGGLRGFFDWAYQLSPAQRNAVASIQPHCHAVYEYMEDKTPTLKSAFPSLGRIYILDCSVEHLTPWSIDISTSKALIEQEVRQREGEDVKVFFGGWDLPGHLSGMSKYLKAGFSS